jgi:16S rRNA processing protein RimM
VTDDGLLLAGRVGAPHGLDGSFHVSQALPELLRDGGVVTISARAYAVNRRAGHDTRLILRLVGVTSRDAALALRGAELRVSRDEAAPLGEDEWWATDLEGCRVIDGDVEVGSVARLLALPSCEVLEVARTADKPALLVPLVGDAVRSVDIAAKLIDIDLGFLGES